MPPTQCRTFNSPVQRAQLDYVNALRGLIEQAVDSNASESQWTTAAALLQQAAATLAPSQGTRALPRFHYPAAAPDPTSLLPYSPVSGRFNPLAPPLEMRQDDDRVIAELSLGLHYEGPPGGVHGAVIASIYDQLMAVANILLGAAGPTAWLHVDYLAPTPIQQPLRFEAWIKNREGRKVVVESHCLLGEQPLTRCEALFIGMVPPT